MSTDLQRQFFEQMGTRHQLQNLYDALPDVFFFTKNRDSRMIWANRQLIRRLGLANENDVVGAYDWEFFPTEVADKYRADDRYVMETGEQIRNRVEVFYDETKILDWHITSKMPVYSEDGSEIIGVAGVIRSYKEGQRWAAPASELEDVVEFMRTSAGAKATIEEIAERAQLSTRQLNRKFQAVFGMSARDFKIRTRLNAAAHDLASSDRSIHQIAMENEFSDQSTFSRQFRKHMGMTPLEYRRSYQRGG
ncbi:AraC family transcriptional regulator [Blastopirellula sp. JC732]|uniref:AraC family transcriptional regulator n=1 Tax=Blastopirellula sediminis TaxID=2894196 RepID=A0A9X1MMM0_9BACT|nr:AraC family transcriptional regulator [Blastopirellula sediminis]MCC9607697.1 AraC family transcriptional regulator [Blastopirellula sediminis]MCC9629010.1 AraC family transcriptional regulator [Blastopirellula sediminis]